MCKNIDSFATIDQGCHGGKVNLASSAWTDILEKGTALIVIKSDGKRKVIKFSGFKRSGFA